MPVTLSSINQKQYQQHPERSDGRLIKNSWNLSNSISPHHRPSTAQSSSFNQITSEGDAVSTSDVYVETRTFRSNLSVASSSTTSGVSSGLGNRGPRSPPVTDRTTSGTPTWTEELTPEFTESSDSGDLGNLPRSSDLRI